MRDIVKDIKGNVINVEDKIKFMYCEFGKPQERRYIISKIIKIDYENKEVIVENGYSCRYSYLSKLEEKYFNEDKKNYTIIG